MQAQDLSNITNLAPGNCNLERLDSGDVVWSIYSLKHTQNKYNRLQRSRHVQMSAALARGIAALRIRDFAIHIHRLRVLCPIVRFIGRPGWPAAAAGRH